MRSWMSMRRTQSFKPLSDEHRVRQHRYQGNGLLPDLIEIGLLPGQQGAPNSVDNGVVAFGIDNPAVAQRVEDWLELLVEKIPWEQSDFIKAA